MAEARYHAVMDILNIEYLESEVVAALNTAASVLSKAPTVQQSDAMDDNAHNLMMGMMKLLRLDLSDPLVGPVSEAMLDVASFDPAATFEQRIARRDDAAEGTARLMILQMVEASKMPTEYAAELIHQATATVLKRPVAAAA